MKRIVCTFSQYHFCGTQTECPLYNKCKELPQKTFKLIPTAFVYTTKNQYLKYYAIPKTYKDKKEHSIKYHYYNYLFGNKKEYMKLYYKTNREIILSKHKIIKSPEQKIFKVQEGFCNMNCEDCDYEDCILPEWNNSKEYMRLYKQTHKEQIKKINKKSYEKNKERKLTKQKEYRAKPEVKKARAEYDKKYRENHREQEREKHRRYYQKHKDEINAKKREKRQLKKEEIKNEKIG